jgi:endogenous inhibitor of DNA gyrase (YacG/DUF329 family)
MAECPTCGEEYANESGVKIHHKRIHGESIAGEKAECEICGDKFRHSSDEAGRFCSHECYGEWKSENYVGRMTNRVEKSCDCCGEEFEVIKSREDTARFCSKDCMWEVQSQERTGENHPNYNSVNKVCSECGDEFEVINARSGAQFCSMDCYTAHRGNKVSAICGYCGVDLRIYKFRVENAERVYCSQECDHKDRRERYKGEDNPNWDGGGSPYYGPSWSRYRQEAIERDGGECYFCGLSRSAHKILYGDDIHVHHVNKKRNGGSNELYNTITLCRTCHYGIE